MLKEGLKAIGSLNKATKSKELGDIIEAASDTSELIKKAARKKKEEEEKKKKKRSNSR
jgi:hypothetical protein